MTPFQRKVGVRVLVVHGIFILPLIFVPMLHGCFKPKKTEIVTFVEFGSPAEAVAVPEEPRMAEPEPPPKETVVPEPVPKEPEIPVPEKSKPQPKPKSAEKPKPKPVEPPKPTPPKPVEKPKWQPVKPEDIKKGTKVGPVAKPRPKLSAEDVKKALSGIASDMASSAANPSEFNIYYAQVMQLFYDRWSPPATASAGTPPAVVRITFTKNGKIEKRAKIKPSGDDLYDRTVMDAVNAVTMLPRPPASYPYDYVEVVFTLDN